jgi:hypothetical protein
VEKTGTGQQEPDRRLLLVTSSVSFPQLAVNDFRMFRNKELPQCGQGE